MMKPLCLQLFIFFSVLTYGQEITFNKNVSYTAQKLKLTQHLNESGDSLILKSETKQIRQVDILNDDYLESIHINGHVGKINLKNLPLGDYVIQAKLGRHWIVMYMEKKMDENTRFVKAKLENADDIKNLIIKDQNTLYWVVYESNSRFASSKTMGLKNINEIDDLISKIKLELKSEVGKYNKLFVYEIYNRTKFIRKQHRNSNYYKSKRSKTFNVLPIYTSENEKNDNS